MMCSRMLIMFDGKILAADTPENLQRRMAGGSQVIAEIAAPLEQLRHAWEHAPEVEHFELKSISRTFNPVRLNPWAKLIAVVVLPARSIGDMRLTIDTYRFPLKNS